MVCIVDRTHVHHVVHEKYQNIPYLVAIVDCTRIGSATGFFLGLGNTAQENITANISIDDQLRPPLDM